eukprot:4359848-Prymnesium_polylepis.2
MKTREGQAATTATARGAREAWATYCGSGCVDSTGTGRTEVEEISEADRRHEQRVEHERVEREAKGNLGHGGEGEVEDDAVCGARKAPHVVSAETRGVVWSRAGRDSSGCALLDGRRAQCAHYGKVEK